MLHLSQTRQSIWRWFKSSDTIVLIVVILVFSSGIIIYASNKPAAASFIIKDLSFKLDESGRSIEFFVQVNRGSIEFRDLLVNNNTLYDWVADMNIVKEGGVAKITLPYFWKMGEYYSIKVVITDGRFTELMVKAPMVIPNLNLEVGDVNVTQNSSYIKIKVPYKAEGNGTEEFHIMLFTYLSYQEQNRTLYIFYDPKYMADESIKRSDVIVDYFRSYNISIEKVDYAGLGLLTKNMSKIILILVNPLKDGLGRRLPNALPAPLIDPNGDGNIKDNSRYGKSLLYDWMKDEGLILITIGSLEPYKVILYADGTYCHARDSFEQFDAHLVLTDALGSERIIKGGHYMSGQYSSIRISDTLGLSYREAPFFFDKNVMERYNLQYYAYGDYIQPTEGGYLNLTLPTFIRVGEGGWLAMGDEEYWLSDNSLAHDLFLIYIHSPWDSIWIPYGWYWDNGGTFLTNNYGIVKSEGVLETEAIPSNLINDKIMIRVVAIANSPEIGKGIIVDRLIEYKMP